jgi:hypothetical protein
MLQHAATAAAANDYVLNGNFLAARSNSGNFLDETRQNLFTTFRPASLSAYR